MAEATIHKHSESPAATNHEFEVAQATIAKMHQDSYRRLGTDTKACEDAASQDQKAVKDLQHGAPNRTLKKEIKEDEKGDRQALRDDPKNEFADRKIVKAEQQLLKHFGDRLTEDQKAVLQRDIEAKTKTANNSHSDVPLERQYIAHDQKLISALRHGTNEQREVAKKDVIKDRATDYEREKSYVADNSVSRDSDKKIADMFGHLTLHDSKRRN